MIFMRMVIVVMMNLVKVDDVLVLHLSENVDLLLNVPHGHPPPGGLHPLLLDVPDHSNYSLHTLKQLTVMITIPTNITIKVVNQHQG